MAILGCMQAVCDVPLPRVINCPTKLASRFRANKYFDLITFIFQIIPGSALCALEGKNPEIGENSVKKLLDTVDNHFKLPDRDPSTEPIFAAEKTYTIKGEFP